jgi:hypothetical protein
MPVSASESADGGCEDTGEDDEKSSCSRRMFSSLALLFSSAEEYKLRGYEQNLNFKFVRAGPPSVSEISEASAEYAAKRLQGVGAEVVQYFLPYAREAIAAAEAEAEAAGTSEGAEVLVARAMAAIATGPDM